MARNHQNQSSLTTQLDRIISSGHISRQAHLQLTSALISGRELTEEDRRQINRVFDHIQIDRIKIVD